MAPPDTSVIGARLLPLGFTRYAEYLASPHWMRMRQLYLTGKRCACGRWATQLHHLTYERLGAELAEDFEALCDLCHASRHARRRRIQRPRQRKKGPARGPSTIPADTALEASIRRFERITR